MFASTLQAVGYRTKMSPTLRSTSSIEKINLQPYDLTAYLRTIESVQKVKKQLNIIYKMRLELLPRDLQSLYEENEQFFSIVLGHPSSEAAFAYYDKDADGKLNEKEQVGIFTHLLTRLYDKKMQCLKAEDLYKEHAKLLNIMSNIEDQLPEVQKNHHRLREQIIKREASLKKKQALNEFDQQIEAEVMNFEETKKEKLAKVREKQRKQRVKLSQTFDQTKNLRLIQVKPSIALRNTKETALIYRLSPYKQEKKRDYECQQLQQTIQRNIQKEEQRINHTIQTHKNLERIRMRQNQKRFAEIENEKLQSKWNKMLSYMEKDKDRLQKHHDRLLMIETNKERKQAAQNIEYAIKAAKSHRQRADSVNISRIVMQHRDILDYGSDVEKLQNLDSSNRNYRYFGSQSIQQNREMMTLQTIESPEEPLKSHRQSISTRYDEPVVQNRLRKRQGSITDLYDSNLNLLR